MDKKNQKSDLEFDYSTIPKFMQEHVKFCLWKLDTKSGKSKPDKITYRINGKRQQRIQITYKCIVDFKPPKHKKTA